MQSHDTAMRVEEIDRYDVITTTPSPELMALAELAARVCGVSGAAVTMLTDIQHHVATYGIDPLVCSLEDSLCHTVVSEPAVVVPDLTLDPRFATNRFVTGELGEVRFYASAPLVSSAGVIIGRLCVFDMEPSALTDAQIDGLDTLARRVMDVLELRVRSRHLEESLRELTVVRDELTRTNQELARSNQELARFAEQASHDLRTPLTSILTNAELLLLEFPDDPLTSEVVGRILSSGRRMDVLFDKVLAYARHGGEPRRTDTGLDDVFQRVLADLGPALSESGAEVTVGTLPRVHADPDLLYLVALNVLTNAVKFARPDVKPQVHVRAERLHDRWRVEVSDNGRGIEPSLKEQMFARYTRHDSQVDGYGIGLATTKRIVQAHGGRVGMSDPPHAGLVVWFELPDAS